MHFIFKTNYHWTKTYYTYGFNCDGMKVQVCSTVMTYSNGIVILLWFFLFILFYCLCYLSLEDFQQQSSLLYENSLSIYPPWELSRPENSMTLCRHYTTPVRRGCLNLQNTSAGARHLLWSAANLSCLPPLWSCLNKNESGVILEAQKALDAAARLPSSTL